MKGCIMSDNLFEDIEGFLKGSNKPSLFTDDECETIITSFVTAREEKGFTEDELVKLFNWCVGARLDGTLLDLMLKGMALVDWNGTEPVWSISPLGKETIDARH